MIFVVFGTFPYFCCCLFCVFSAICVTEDPTICRHVKVCCWIFVYAAPDLGTILSLVLVHHPILALHTACVKAVLMSVNFVGWRMDS